MYSQNPASISILFGQVRSKAASSHRKHTTAAEKHQVPSVSLRVRTLRGLLPRCNLHQMQNFCTCISARSLHKKPPSWYDIEADPCKPYHCGKPYRQSFIFPTAEGIDGLTAGSGGIEMLSLEDVLIPGLKSLGFPADSETLLRFHIFYDLLTERGKQMNLTAIAGEEDTARLHFLDCAAILSFLLSSDSRNATDALSSSANIPAPAVLDIGSGAGFPGLVLKILCPSMKLTLLDSLQKRVHFQEELCAALGFPDVHCLHARAEELPQEMRESFDYVVSRAVARLNVLSELCLPYVAVGGTFLAMKGASADEEFSEALPALKRLGAASPVLQRYTVPGLDASRAAVLALKTSATPRAYPRRFAQIRKQPLS